MLIFLGLSIYYIYDKVDFNHNNQNKISVVFILFSVINEVTKMVCLFFYFGVIWHKNVKARSKS